MIKCRRAFVLGRNFGGLSVSDAIPVSQNPNAQIDADAGPNSEKSTPGTKSVVETAQNLLGFLIAGFAAVLSFIGIKSSELASILRNEEPFIGIVALAFLLSIITAIISIFKGNASHDNPNRPSNRFAVATLIFLFALVTFLPAVIHIPFVTSPSQVIASIIVGVLVLAVALTIAFYNGARHETFKSWTSWLEKPFNPQLYFILVSVMFLTIAAYAALRLESASQASPFAQLDGTVTVVSNNSAILSLSVASAKVPAPDRVDITVTGLPRTANIEGLCKGIVTPLDSFSCAADPCSYKPLACDSLVGWTVPPNATGAVQETLALPFSPAAYQRLHVEDQLCERASVTRLCASKPPGGTHLDVEVPAPSA
jgi:hypothetical protein